MVNRSTDGNIQDAHESELNGENSIQIAKESQTNHLKLVSTTNGENSNEKAKEELKQMNGIEDNMESKGDDEIQNNLTSFIKSGGDGDNIPSDTKHKNISCLNSYEHQHIETSMSKENKSNSIMSPGDITLIINDAETRNETNSILIPNKQEKAKDILNMLRGIVSNPCHDFKSKFNNINFTKTVKNSLDAYTMKFIQPISLKDSKLSEVNNTELSFGFRQAHIDNADADKNLGLSPKIFNKKPSVSQNSSKVKHVKKHISTSELKSKNLVKF